MPKIRFQAFGTDRTAVRRIVPCSSPLSGISRNLERRQIRDLGVGSQIRMSAVAGVRIMKRRRKQIVKLRTLFGQVGVFLGKQIENTTEYFITCEM